MEEAASVLEESLKVSVAENIFSGADMLEIIYKKFCFTFVKLLFPQM